MTYLTSKEFKRLLKGKTVIGHSGHRDLLLKDFQTIREKVRGKLKELVKDNPKKFVLMTGFARGADEQVAEVAASLGIQVTLLVIDKEVFPSFDQGDVERIGKLENKKEIYVYKLNKDTSNQTPYEILSELLVVHSTHLLALWDGVVTGKAGGTWQVVTDFKNQNFFKGSFWQSKVHYTIHHLFSPRQGNTIPSAQAYFKHPIFPRKKYDWETTVINVYRKSFITKSFNWIGRLIRKIFPVSTGILLRFLLPLLLVFCVLVLGMIGYLGPREKNWTEFWNSVFFSANLITLDQSIFLGPYNWQMDAARLLGGSFTVVVFFIALYFASGKEIFYRFMFLIFRKWNWFKRFLSKVISWISFGKVHPKWANGFAVVIGLNEIAYDIVRDLRHAPINSQRRVRVVILNSDPTSAFMELARNEGTWIIKGVPTDSASLGKIHFQDAEQVFVVTGSEEENVRCVMEMDQVISRNKKSPAEDWFVHIQDRKLKQLLQQSISGRTNYALTVFSHAENTARRMLAGFPELRGEPFQTIIAIVGFGPIGKALVLKSIQQLVFSKSSTPKVLVYYTEAETEAVSNFIKEYSYLFPSSNVAKDPAFEAVTDWTFFEGSTNKRLEDRVTFFPLPLISQQLTHSQSPLLNNMAYFGKLKLFACLDSGLESASVLTAALPGLERVKLEKTSYDIQAYCFYNFPDEDEEAYLEQKLNALAPHIPVKCFGNYLYEFSCKAIQNKEADHLAKQIALWYYLLYDYGSQSIRRMMEIEERFSKMVGAIDELQNGFLPNDTNDSFDVIMKAKIEGLKLLWHHALTDNQVLAGMLEMMRYCWKSLSETDREGNRQAADHLWVKVTEFDKTWKLSDKPSDIMRFQEFWSEKEIEDLGVIEHRRWNTMKVLDGWRPFEGTDWKKHKENYKAQKLHNLLVTFDDLDKNEKVKDYHQIEGISYFIALLYLDQYQTHISIN